MEIIMDLEIFLENNAPELLDEAHKTLERANLKHYADSQNDENFKRLEDLYYLTIEAIRNKNLLPMKEHAENIAKKRFEAGFDFYEVHSAFNVLEETIWKKVIKVYHPANLGEALGMISTILGAGKEMLACAYISLAGKGKKCSMDVSEIFKR